MESTCYKYFNVLPNICGPYKLRDKEDFISAVIAGNCSNRVYMLLYHLGDKAPLYLSYISLFNSYGILWGQHCYREYFIRDKTLQEIIKVKKMSLIYFLL